MAMATPVDLGELDDRTAHLGEYSNDKGHRGQLGLMGDCSQDCDLGGGRRGCT